MKKGRVIFWVIFAIIALLAFNFLQTNNFLKKFDNHLKDMKGQLTVKNNNDNLPEFSNKYKYSRYKNPKDNIRETPQESTLYDLKSQEKIIKETEKKLPENWNEYKTELAPSILELMKKEKTKKYPTAEETENYPEPPQLNLVRQTIYFWGNLSLVLSNQGDYKTSLLIAHGIFYLIRDIQSSYANSGGMLKKMIMLGYYRHASRAILVWASKAHPECQELSKLVAKDILKFVEAEYPLRRNIEFSKYNFDCILKHLSQKTYLVGSNVFNKSYYKEAIEFLINEPLKIESQYESKNFYEVKDLYSKYKNKLEDTCKKYDSIFPNYCINPEKAIVYFVASFFIQNMEKIRSCVEDALGYMEFAAIALLINSYYCQNGNLPQSIEELEKWFGQKLPVSRLDNKPYEIDTKGKHLLTFKHIVDIVYNYNQLYFDFFK